jgi:hypothetical protein
MRSLLVLAQTGIVLAVASASPALAQAQPRVAAVSASECTLKVQITGKKVAIRDEAKPDAPIVAFVEEGDILPSCWKVIGRGEPYKKCGAEGYDWYLVNIGTPKSGYVPMTCARAL